MTAPAPAAGARPGIGDVLVRPLLLGLATGSRTTAGLTAVAFSRTRYGARQPRAFLTSDLGRRLTALGAAGEAVGDLLPVTPSRLRAPGLGGRVAAAAAAGLAVADRDGTDPVTTASISVTGAVAGAFAGAAVRAAAARAGRRDWPVALAEDLVAAALAFVGAASAR